MADIALESGHVNLLQLGKLLGKERRILVMEESDSFLKGESRLLDKLVSGILEKEI